MLADHTHFHSRLAQIASEKVFCRCKGCDISPSGVGMDRAVHTRRACHLEMWGKHDCQQWELKQLILDRSTMVDVAVR